MWLLPLMAVLLWTLTGCVSYVPYTHSPPLLPSQLGSAADCDWDTGQPRNCLTDPTRATIDLDRLQQLMDAVERCQTDALERRKL